MINLPQPLSQPLPVPEPVDTVYPGNLHLEVDATDVLRGIFHVRETIPVQQSGVLTLMFPKWLPGYHAPQAQIELLAGLEFRALGKRLHWARHPTEVYAFHVDVPEGAEEIEASFQFLSPTDSAQGRVVVTPDLLSLQWNSVLLYPAGYFSRGIQVEPRLTLPDGWSLGCAMDVVSVDRSTITFARTGLDDLIDSPVMAGRYARRVALDDDGRVALNIFADTPDLLDATPDQLQPHKAVVEQADLLFGPRPFDRFEVLLSLSDEMGSIGVEHHRSCEIVSIPGYFRDWDASFPRRDSFPHEYVHGWNGKYRRGADSWAPCFYQPIRNSLMWVYEGQTQYWDRVLSARSGLWSPDQALAAFADTAATHDLQPGSRWRPMSDTTKDPIIAARAELPWPSWQRSEDYYSEGALVWMDVDTRIRELTDDMRSLDDFAWSFFGRHDEAGPGVSNVYKFDDLIRTLNEVAQFDWSSFFVDKLQNIEGHAPLDGLSRGGYRLAYRSEPSSMWTAKEQLTGITSFLFSLGLSVSAGGKVKEVLWESAAFKAAITAGSTLIGVNGLAFTPDKLRRAIASGADGKDIRLIVQAGKHQRVVELQCPEGHRYPHLEPIPGARRRLDEILAPKRADRLAGSAGPNGAGATPTMGSARDAAQG